MCEIYFAGMGYKVGSLLHELCIKQFIWIREFDGPEVVKVVHLRGEHDGEVVPRMVVQRLHDQPREPENVQISSLSTLL